MTALRLAFAGTPAFAVPVLRAIVEAGHTVLLVVTQPDRPAGRGLHPAPPPVKELALRLGLPLWQPERPTPAEWLAELAGLSPDALVVAAYAYRIPSEVLKLPPYGCLNVHPSLLPRWRGAAPVTWALLAGDRTTGVTVMQMDEGLDTGPMLLQRLEVIRPGDTAGTLEVCLAHLGAGLLVEALRRLEAGWLQGTAQDPAGVTRAPRLEREDGRLDWAQDAFALERRIRAFDPWPGTFVELGGRRVKVLRARARADQAAREPGTVVALSAREGWLGVACGSGVLELLQVQVEGGRPISGADLANGYRLRPGARLAAAP